MARRISLFLVLTFSLSWSCWGLNIWLVRSTGVSSSALHFAGAFGPFVAAWLTTIWLDGWSAFQVFLRRLYGRVATRWILFAVLLPVVLFGCGMMVITIFVGTPDVPVWFANDKLPAWSPVWLWLLWVATYGLGEESGWRGCLFPALSKRMAVRPSTVVIAFVWAFWHVPVFLYDPDFQAMSGFIVMGWGIGLLFGSFFLGWLTVQAEGNIWPAILFHGTFDFFSAGDAVPDLVPAVSSALLIGLVLVLTRRYDSQFLKVR